MSAKYEVIGGRPEVDESISLDESDLEYARAMRETYGLNTFSVSDIARIWRAHSRSMEAGWLMETGPEEIEQVFGVKLRKLGYPQE